MKRLIALALAAASCAAVGVGMFRTAKADGVAAPESKSACLIEATTGKIIYENNAYDHMPVASVCKVMTLTLCFEAIEQGKLDIDGTVTASERAAGMGGSQVFLQSGLSYPVQQLIKSVVVCSANDSCVALSECISGSEEQFVAAMNKKAADLGCNDTLFANCTGLPKDTQYSCARDVAIMFANLITYPQYLDYSSVWLEDFIHPGGRVTSMTNTNKLIKSYAACDGGKTGFTNEAGFCLAATATKDNLRLISVVLGGTTSKGRFDGVVSLFNYGFDNYVNKIVLDKNVNLNDKVSVQNGKKESISVRPQSDGLVFCARNEKPQITFNVVFGQICAPLAKGDGVGKIEIYKDGVFYGEVQLVCAEDVERANYFDNWQKIADSWQL